MIDRQFERSYAHWERERRCIRLPKLTCSGEMLLKVTPGSRAAPEVNSRQASVSHKSTTGESGHELVGGGFQTRRTFPANGRIRERR